VSTKKTILIRLDKIGDLVATLPVDQAKILSDSSRNVEWMVAEGLEFLCRLAEPKRQCQSFSLKSPWQSFQKILIYLKVKKPDEVVIFYAPWWASLAVWLARVPLRAGRLSQWHSFLFFNRGLRQSRSNSDLHEAQYNWELLHFALGKTRPQDEPPFLNIKAPQHRQLLEKYALSARGFVVVHPGMAGSALNWPQAKYNELIERLVEFIPVVVTGTLADNPWLTQIEPRWKKDHRVRWLQNRLNSEELVYILQNAKLVIAPSTGVLHLAVGAGTPSVGIYSNLKAHHPRRWGPRGLGVKIVMPEADCHSSADCMNTIEVSQIMNRDLL
jgi:ADP-heptose:LPS heptosyltransferase